MTARKWGEKTPCRSFGGDAASLRDFVRSESADSRLFVGALDQQFSDRHLLREVGTLRGIYPALGGKCGLPSDVDS